MGMLGLKDLALGADGLSLTWDQASSFVTIDIGGVLRQVFTRNGQTFEEEYPR